MFYCLIILKNNKPAIYLIAIFYMRIKLNIYSIQMHLKMMTKSKHIKKMVYTKINPTKIIYMDMLSMNIRKHPFKN